MKYCLFFILLSSITFGQSEFLDRGNFGIMAGYTFSTNSLIKGTDIGVGVSFDGLVDIAAEYSESTYGNNSREKVESSGVLFYAAYNIKRKKTNLKIMMGYVQSYAGNNGHIGGPVFGFLFSARLHNSDAISIMPGLGFTYGLISDKDDGSFVSNTGSLSFGIDFALKTPRSISIIFSPSVSKDISISKIPLIYGFSASFLIDFKTQSE